MSPEVLAALRDDLTIDITTIGRRTGEPRRIEIWYLHIDGRFFITGTPGPRHWLANLRANPRFTFHLKETVTVDLEAVATEVRDEATRTMVIDHAVAQWYREQTDRHHLIAAAPMVEVTFPGA